MGRLWEEECPGSDEEENKVNSTRSPSNGIIDGAHCNNPVTVDEEGCNPRAPDHDGEGDVCRYDGLWNESYCSYGIGPRVCAFCKDSTFSALPFDFGKILNKGDDDEEGADEDDEEEDNKIISKLKNLKNRFGNSASARAPSTAVINGVHCNDPVIVDDRGCNPRAPDNDGEGDVCRNDGLWNEAYCSYGIGRRVCAFCNDLSTNDGNAISHTMHRVANGDYVIELTASDLLMFAAAICMVVMVIVVVFLCKRPKRKHVVYRKVVVHSDSDLEAERLK